MRLRVLVACAVSIANGAACKQPPPPDPGPVLFCGDTILPELPHLVVCPDPHVTETDLWPLYGLALTDLHLGGSGITDLYWVGEFPTLRELDISDSGVRDLSPLAGTSIALLDISRTRVEDLGPLHDLPSLTSLSISDTHVTDLRPLAGLPRLVSLDASITLVEDVTPLAQVPRLADINLRRTLVADASALAARPPPVTIELDESLVTDCTALIAIFGPPLVRGKYSKRIAGVSCSPLDDWGLTHARKYIEDSLVLAQRGRR